MRLTELLGICPTKSIYITMEDNTIFCFWIVGCIDKQVQNENKPVSHITFKTYHSFSIIPRIVFFISASEVETGFTCLFIFFIYFIQKDTKYFITESVFVLSYAIIS